MYIIHSFRQLAFATGVSLISFEPIKEDLKSYPTRSKRVVFFPSEPYGAVIALVY